MHFIKMHGTGNDFIMVDNLDGKTPLSPQQIKALCNRHFGIGADAVILIEQGRHGEDCFMNYWNADGTLAEMCGNGTRCMAHYMREFKGFDKDMLNLDTRAGSKRVDLLENGLFRSNMGAPAFASNPDFPDEPQVFEGYKFYFASMGNPHAVTIVEDEEEALKVLNTLAPDIEVNLKHFPNRINVSVVWQKSEKHFGAKTHERGCGQTLACGTAMSATFALLAKNEFISKDDQTQIDVPGGILVFEYNENGEILMTGPSEIVFFGEIKIDD